MRHYTFALAMLAMSAAPAHAEAPVYGLGHAKDGDSLMVGDTEVRLFGIDAPEWDQSCQKNGQDWSCGRAAVNFVTQRKIATLVSTTVPEPAKVLLFAAGALGGTLRARRR